jgi:hypothetical protein
VILLNKAVSAIIVILLVFAFTGMAFSAENNKKTQVFGGKITAINTKEKTITLKNDETPKFTCIFNDKTLIRMTNGQKPIDMKINDIIAVLYEEVNGKNIAKSISALAPAASSSKGQSKP